MWNPSSFTVSVKVWLAFGNTPLAAVMVIGNRPPEVGVPESTPALVTATPGGSEPDSLNEGPGVPVAVTVKVPAEPSVNAVELAEVITGGASTVSGDDADMDRGIPSRVPDT